MTTVHIPAQITLSSTQLNTLKRCPYSFEYDSRNSRYQYEIIGYGLEHLDPWVFLIEFLNVDRISDRNQGNVLAVSKTCLRMGVYTEPVKDGLFNFVINPCEADYFKKLLAEYQAREVFKVDYSIDNAWNLRISNLVPLRKLLRKHLHADESRTIGVALIHRVLRVLKRSYYAAEDVEHETFHLDGSVLSSIKNTCALTALELNLFKTLNGERPVRLDPVYAYLPCVKTRIFHYLAMDYNKGYDVQDRSHETKRSESHRYLNMDLKNMLSMLNVLKYTEQNVLHVNKCRYCERLKNPVSQAYSVYCSEPVVCHLRDGVGNVRNYTCSNDLLYVWYKDRTDRPVLKSVIERFCNAKYSVKRKIDTRDLELEKYSKALETIRTDTYSYVNLIYRGVRPIGVHVVGCDVSLVIVKLSTL